MTHPLAGFDRVYIINLPSRQDRREEMQAQLQRIGLGLESPQVQLYAAQRPADKGGFPTIGAHGCFLSHLGCLQDAAAARLNSMLILEDDLNFSDDFLQAAPPVLQVVQAQDWQFFYAGHRLQGPTPRPQKPGWVEVPSSTDVVCAHFLAFRQAAIQTAVPMLRAMLQRPPGHPEGGPMHVDGAYNWVRRANPSWRTLAAVPELGYQRASQTNIHELPWFDKIPLLRSVVAQLRRRRNQG